MMVKLAGYSSKLRSAYNVNTQAYIIWSQYQEGSAKNTYVTGKFNLGCTI